MRLVTAFVLAALLCGGCAASSDPRGIVDRLPVGTPADRAERVLRQDGFTLLHSSPGLIYAVQGADPVFGSSRQVTVRLTLDNAGRIKTRQAFTTHTGS